VAFLHYSSFFISCTFYILLTAAIFLWEAKQTVTENGCIYDIILQKNLKQIRKTYLLQFDLIFL